jgi:hypothetical protein
MRPEHHIVCRGRLFKAESGEIHRLLGLGE